MREITTAFGSLRVVPRDPQHIHGDGDDGTTTRWHKAHEMAGGINLRMPVQSIRKHQRARAKLVVSCIALALVAALAVRWAWRMYGL